MGGNESSNVMDKKGLPPIIYEKAKKIFEMIDIDKSNTIEKSECMKFWQSNFAKANTDALFENVDKNGDDQLQFEEWIEFWKIVRKNGYSDTEIEEEVLLNSWITY